MKGESNNSGEQDLKGDCEERQSQLAEVSERHCP